MTRLLLLLTIVAGVSVLHSSHSALADTKPDLTKSLAVCAGRLSTAAPYSQSYADSQSAMSLNAKVLAIAQNGSRLDDTAVQRLAQQAGKQLSDDILRQPMASRSLAAKVRQECNDLAKEAQLTLRGRDAVEGVAQRTDQNSFKARPADHEGHSEKQQAVVEQSARSAPVLAAAKTPPQASKQEVQNQTEIGQNSDPRVIPDASTNQRKSVLAEFESWKADEKKQREEETKAKELSDKKAAQAEAERLEKLKPIMEKQAQDAKIRDEIAKKRSAIAARRKDDTLNYIWGAISDVESPDYRESCEFTPDVAETILTIYEHAKDRFRSEALEELAKHKLYIAQDVIYDFMSEYVIDTLAGNENSKKVKLINAINGKTFSALCFLYAVTPNVVQKINARVADATRNMNESFDPVSIDTAEPYYGLLCARLAADNKRLILSRVILANWFGNKAHDLKEAEPTISELFSFYQHKLASENPDVLRTLLSNEWNKQCVELSTKT